MDQPGVIYEVTLACDPSVDEELLAWLEPHVAATLGVPGFTGARILEVDPDHEDGWPRHTVHYHLTDRAALDQYLTEHAGTTRGEASARFGDAIRIEQRILRSAQATGSPTPPHCLNCGQVLHGQYCGTCGQRSSSRLISLWGLISEGLGDLLDMDSRLWRTLRALLLRPGYLTAEYLAGRRARFMPPFRMYLAFSLIFFVVAFFGVDDLQISFDGEADGQTEQGTRDAAADPAAGLEDAPDPDVSPEEPGRSEREREESPPGAGNENEGPGTDPASTCDRLNFKLEGWLGERLTEDRAREACRRVVADRGRSLARALIDDLPTALFAFLPILALVLKILYPLSRRYYVEHLLFIVHYQSFLFLILSLQVLLGRLTEAISHFGWLSATTAVVVTFYIPIYLHRSLRRVYGQGFLATFTKFVLLSLAYFIAFAILMALTAVVAALSL